MSNPTVTLIGAVVNAPELSFTPGGHALCKFRIVTKDFRKSDAGQWEEHDASFFGVTVWRQMGEFVAESDLIPGDEVIVVGKIKMREWQTDAGEKRVSYDVTADAVGPSLKWHGVKPIRVERGAQAASTDAGFDPWASQPAVVPAGQADAPPF